MILNKSGVDRGLAHATVIKTETVDLRDEKGKDYSFVAAVAGPRDQHFRPISALGQKLPQNILSKPGSHATASRHVRPQVGHGSMTRFILRPIGISESMQACCGAAIQSCLW